MITSERVREIALLPNFDKGLITDSMIQATVDRHIIPLLGQDLYDACESYPTLFSKVEMALANLVIYDHMPRLYMRLTSTGAKTLNASNTQTSSEKDRAY